MRIRRTLTVLALVLSTAVASTGVAGPANGGKPDRDGGKEPRVLVLDDVKSDVTIGEIQKTAQEAVGERLPEVSQVTAVSAEKDQLTSDQLVAVIGGREAPGAKRLGELAKPTSANTLHDLGRAAGGIIVVGWRCYIVVVGGHWYLVCIPVVIIRA